MQPLSPVKTEFTTTIEDDLASPAAVEGRLLSDTIGTSRFHGEVSDNAFVDELKAFLRGCLPPGEARSVPTSIGRCQTSDSRPLPLPDDNPLWLPPAGTTSTMLSVLRSFIQDGPSDGPASSGGIYWWGNLRAQPTVPSSSGNVETDIRSTRRLAFYQAALAVACRIASTKSAAPGLTPDRSEPFFSRAISLLGNPLNPSHSSIGEVSVLSLMAYYLLQSDRPEAAALYVSLAARTAISLGAHRGHVDERGKRIFWTLYVLDREVSALLGRPPAIPAESVLLSFPVDIPYVFAPRQSMHDSILIGPFRSMPPCAGLHAHVELSRISDHITCNLYQVAPTREAADGSAANLEKASFLLEQWLASLPPALQLSKEGLSNDPATCSLHMLANHLVIVSQRPSLLSTLKATNPSAASPRSPIAAPGEECIAAAHRNMRLARHLATLHRPRRLLHSGLRFVFGAALCFLLQSLVGNDNVSSAREIQFAVELFDREAQASNTYGLSCASVLRELQTLAVKLSGGATAMEFEQALGHAAEQHFGQASTDVGLGIPQDGMVDGSGGISLHDEVLSWMEHDWGYGSMLP